MAFNNLKSAGNITVDHLRRSGILAGVDDAGVSVSCTPQESNFSCSLTLPSDVEQLKKIAANLVSKKGNFVKNLTVWDPTLKVISGPDGKKKLADEKDGKTIEDTESAEATYDRVALDPKSYEVFSAALEKVIQKTDPSYVLGEGAEYTYCETSFKHPAYTPGSGTTAFQRLEQNLSAQQVKLVVDALELDTEKSMCVDEKSDDGSTQVIRFVMAKQKITDLLKAIDQVTAKNYKATDKDSAMTKKAAELVKTFKGGELGDFKDALNKYRDGLGAEKRLPSMSFESIWTNFGQMVLSLLGSYLIFRNMTANQQKIQHEAIKKEDANRDWLKDFGSNLNEKFSDFKTNPAIGREDETKMMIDILNRNEGIDATKQKGVPNSPAILGEAGVGKTSLIEAFAWLIETKHPSVAKYHGYTVISINLTELAKGFGTAHVGDLQRIVGNIIKQAQAKHGKVIIYMDEVHRLMEIGKSSSSTLSVAEEFKDVMGRGELKIVVSTTTQEFRDHVEPNKAFRSRLIVVQVEEPKPDALRAIITNYIKGKEAQYGLKVDNKLVSQIPSLAKKYFAEAGANPRSAIAMVDALYEYHLKKGYGASKKIDQTLLNEYVATRQLESLRASVNSAVTEINDLFTKFERLGYYEEDEIRALDKIPLEARPVVEDSDLTRKESAAEILKKLTKYKFKLGRLLQMAERGVSEEPDMSELLRGLSRERPEPRSPEQNSTAEPGAPAPAPVAEPAQPQPFSLAQALGALTGSETQKVSSLEAQLVTRGLIPELDALREMQEKMVAQTNDMSGLDEEARCRLLLEGLVVFKDHIDHLKDEDFRGRVVEKIVNAAKEEGYTTEVADKEARRSRLELEKESLLRRTRRK